MNKVKAFFKWLFMSLVWIIRLLLGTILLLLVVTMYLLIKLTIQVYKWICLLTAKLFPYYLAIIEKLH